jgi:hypothetical protein
MNAMGVFSVARGKGFTEDDFRAVWFAAFAAATVALRDWIDPQATCAVEVARRHEAKRLADKAVLDLRQVCSGTDRYASTSTRPMELPVYVAVERKGI